MKRLLFPALFLVLLTVNAQAQQTVSDSLVSGGIMRYYHVYVPKNFIKGSSRPLIIHLHGYGSNGLLEQLFTNYMPVADTAGFLVVYPEGLVDSSGHQYWNVGFPTLPGIHNDVDFISSLIDVLHGKYSINTAQVYASGLSMGGYMCYDLAWKLSDKIAAIASVSGSMYPATFALCKPPRPIPVMEIHGTSDNTVPYDGSSISTNIDTLMRFWVLSDHCFPISDPISVPDIDPTDGSTVIHFQWTPELLNMSVELYRINGGTHVDWPGSGAGNNMDFSASPTIWQFFNRFQTSTSSVKTINEGSSPLMYPNPCSGILHIDVQGKTTIIDIAGRTVLTSNEHAIDIHTLTPGCYQIVFDQNGILKTEKLLKF